MKNNEESLHESWDNIKGITIQIIGVPGEARKEQKSYLK